MIGVPGPRLSPEFVPVIESTEFGRSFPRRVASATASRICCRIQIWFAPTGTRTSGGSSVEVLTMSSSTLVKKEGSIPGSILNEGPMARWQKAEGSMAEGFRSERDPLGELQVPANAYYGVQTLRAVENFPISGLRAPADLVVATILVKKAAAEANAALGRLPPDIADAIRAAA